MTENPFCLKEGVSRASFDAWSKRLERRSIDHLGTAHTPLPISIPQDLASCRALIEQLATTVGEQSRQIQTPGQEVAELLGQTLQKRSERYLPHPDQMWLDFGDSDQAVDATEGLAQAIEEAGAGDETVKVASHRRKRTRKRRAESLPTQPREPFEKVAVWLNLPAPIRTSVLPLLVAQPCGVHYRLFVGA